MCIVIVRIVIVAACMSMTCSAYAAAPCHTGKDGDGYWSWREIDGRRCWYRGKPGKPKAELYWQAAPKRTATPARPAPAPPAPASSPVVDLHVTPAIPAPTADMLRAQPMTETVLIVETPGAMISDAGQPEADSCCWPPLDELPFAERWRGMRR
jgi:hypothetical protein